MRPLRARRIVPAAAAALLLLAATAPAADAPVATISGSVSPNKFGRLTNGVGHSLRLTLQGRVIKDENENAPIMTQMILSLPTNAVENGRLFPSCTASIINRAHGRASACPAGSRIGTGTALAFVHGLDITSSGHLFTYNGPGGHSVVLQAVFTQPADIDVAFNAPLVRTKGKYGYKTTITIPDSLRDILPGNQAGLTSFKMVLGATTTQKVKGRKIKRGYIEPVSCPKNRNLPMRGDFRYLDGSSTSATSTIHVSCSS